jgi:Protein of unknown function (DUF559)
MTRRTELPPGVEAGAFSVEDARELEIPRSRLRAKDLAVPFRSVRRLTIGDDEAISRCQDYVPIMQHGQLFSHLTAARLYGIPLPRRLDQSELIDVWATGVQAKTSGVIGHRSRPLPARSYRGLPVVDPAYVLVQLATSLRQTDLVVAGDYLVRRKLPLSTLPELREAVRVSRGVRGIRTLRLALGEVRPLTDSPMETRMRLVLMRAGLPEPVIRNTIFDAAGDFVGTPDLAYVEERIAIEYEGDQHRTDAVIFAADIERRERMQEAGWYVIRVISNHVLRQPQWLVDRVRRQLVIRRHLSLSSNAL